MKLKSEKGFIGTDIATAVLIITIFMSILGVLYFNIAKTSKAIERESQATYIATEVMEVIKSKQYNDVKLTNGDIAVTKDGSNYKYVGTENNNNVDVVLGSNIPLEAGYTCEVNIENYKPANEENKDLIKIVQVKVSYKVANQPQEVKLETAILK